MFRLYLWPAYTVGRDDERKEQNSKCTEVCITKEETSFWIVHWTLRLQWVQNFVKYHFISLAKILSIPKTMLICVRIEQLLQFLAYAPYSEKGNKRMRSPCSWCFCISSPPIFITVIMRSPGCLHVCVPSYFLRFMIRKKSPSFLCGLPC
jgi:hypothetical protein